MSTVDSRDDRNDSVSITDEEAVKKILVDSVLGLWDTVNNLTRIRPSRRDRYRVTIFGSARAKPGSFTYEETKRAAAELAKLGCDIITGGGPGLILALFFIASQLWFHCRLAWSASCNHWFQAEARRENTERGNVVPVREHVWRSPGSRIAHFSRVR